jgi:gamma-glutamylcyclotransferase (GGCT)/AIG2-like uncharacterized protein YtfP
MKGLGNHGTMTRARGVFVREDVTRPEFTLYSLGAFPAMARNGKTAVRGEVYEVPLVDMKVLDALESEGTFYHRVPVTLASGAIVQTYILIMENHGFTDTDVVVESGDWRKAPRQPTYVFRSQAAQIDWHELYGDAPEAELEVEVVASPDDQINMTADADWWEETLREDRPRSTSLSGMTAEDQAEFDAWQAENFKS